MGREIKFANTLAKTPRGSLVHVVSIETKWTWCSRDADRMDAVSEGFPTCVACIASRFEWYRPWTTPRLKGLRR